MATASTANSFRCGPHLQKLAPVLTVVLGQRVATQRDFLPILLGGKMPAQQPKAQKHEIGITHIGFTIVSNRYDLARLVSIPHLGTIHTQLAGKPAQFGQRIERRGGARLVERRQILQIKMMGMIAGYVAKFEISMGLSILAWVSSIMKRRSWISRAANLSGTLSFGACVGR